MIKIENLETWGFEHAIRGMRNPMNSWAKSDSFYPPMPNEIKNYFVPKNFYLGPNDLELMRKLYLAGTEHRKFMRQIFISLDITAPLYWWKEFDTYKVGTVTNSCSTMHKLQEKEFAWTDFSAEHLLDDWFASNTLGYGDTPSITPNVLMDLIIEQLNLYRAKFLETTDKKWWWQMIQLLPSSYNQRRTITMTYENAATIVHQRHSHKLDEWQNFVSVLVQDLPYFAEIAGKEKE